MNDNQILSILKQHGFRPGRMISFSKSGYVRRHRKHLVVFNAKILTKHALILRGADLDLTLDGEKLTAAATEAGEDFFVLQEGDPSPFWEPKGEPLERVISSAIWWTRTQPENEDIFLPVDVFLRKRRGIRLRCTTGIWLGQPAFSVTCWENDVVYNQNLTGSAVELSGFPPKHFVMEKRAMGEKIFFAPSQTRGRPVRPVLYHRSGPLEYIWFSHGVSISAVLFANTIGKLAGLTFTIHRDVEAIHIRRTGKVVGMLWPNSYTQQHLVKSAGVQLRSMMDD